MFILILCFLSKRYVCINFKADGLKPYAATLTSRSSSFDKSTSREKNQKSHLSLLNIHFSNITIT